jgi:hypothetical protein
VQQAKLLASDGAANDAFGSSVAAAGNEVWIGAPGHANSVGAAYLFGPDGAGWSERQQVGASTPGDFAFGQAVAMSGDAAVFSTSDVYSGVDATYVFRRSNASWGEETRLLPADAIPGTSVHQVAISGDTVLAAGLDAVYVFRTSAGVWSQEAKIVAPQAGTSFGSSVALDGDTALVGAFAAHRAYTFHRAGTSSRWPPVGLWRCPELS